MIELARVEGDHDDRHITVTVEIDPRNMNEVTAYRRIFIYDTGDSEMEFFPLSIDHFLQGKADCIPAAALEGLEEKAGHKLLERAHENMELAKAIAVRSGALKEWANKTPEQLRHMVAEYLREAAELVEKGLPRTKGEVGPASLVYMVGEFMENVMKLPCMTPYEAEGITRWINGENSASSWDI